MTGKIAGWMRQGEAFWRAHHEAWKRSDLNQRQYCEVQCIPLKAFGNWRVVFKAEPQPMARKLLYRRQGLSPPLSPPVSPIPSHPVSPMAYPSSTLIVARPREGHRRRFSEAAKHQIIEELMQAGAGVAAIARRYGIDRRVLRRWKQERAAVTAPAFVTVQISDVAPSSGEGSAP